MTHSVLLDTSFFIRLLNDEDPLHQNARDYFKYFLEQDIVIKTSTITIAEYCVGGSIDDLPLRNIQILPFNLDHAKRTGEFARAIFDEKKTSLEDLKPRAIIPNDSKLFAQSDTDKSVLYFVTSDSRSLNTFKLLSSRIKPSFEIIDINTPYNQTFGVLDLK
ncbi:MAG: hypothetical protein JW801_06415 [Bacteroidales bacterium]|nr:hypothetical protein [Bacteroidales bacterium]